MHKTRSPNRAQEILQTLATMLEEVDAGPITTAALARRVGVSEAALYRHFPSKARMYRGLVEFIEESLYGHVRNIIDESRDAQVRCGKIMNLYLGFAERNPGLCRVLNGDALCSEEAALRRRARRINSTLETQLKQVFREALFDGPRALPSEACARLLMSIGCGRVELYIASEFKNLPTDGWQEQWQLLAGSLFANLDRGSQGS